MMWNGLVIIILRKIDLIEVVELSILWRAEVDCAD